MPQTKKRTQPSYTSNYTFQKKLDQLPTGPGWTCEVVSSTGDCVGPNGKPLIERHELWRRDPVECVRELIGNPAFKEYISYVPEMVYADDQQANRVYDEMWTGNWWWEMQVSAHNYKQQKPKYLRTSIAFSRTVYPLALSLLLSSSPPTRPL